MRVVIRVDASQSIGTGHVMRCLTLAEALRKEGAWVAFVCRELKGHLGDLIANRGFDVTLLPSLAMEADWEADSQQTRDALLGWGEVVDWLVVDHYLLDARWERTLRPLTRRILVIDDLADRCHDADILLDQNYYDSLECRYTGLVSQSCRQLLGPQYALLSEQFTQFRGRNRRDGRIRRVLVFFGGSDPTSEVLKTLGALQSFDSSGLFFDVIAGNSNPNAEAIEALVECLENVEYHRHVENMSERMASADLFIGAGGATNWERCCLGVPSLVISVASNQERVCEALAASGYILYLGTSAKVSSDTIGLAIRVLLHSPWLRTHLSESSSLLVDGAGTNRVVKEMLPPKVTLRAASEDDAAMILSWRNAETTRRFIFDPSPITWEQHLKWFRTSLKSSSRAILIARNNNNEFGVLRYDWSEDTAIVSVYMDPSVTGQGFGAPLIQAGTEWLKQNLPQIRRIRAEILPENIPSQKAFQRAGYSINCLLYEEVLRP